MSRGGAGVGDQSSPTRWSRSNIPNVIDSIESDPDIGSDDEGSEGSDSSIEFPPRILPPPAALVYDPPIHYASHYDDAAAATARQHGFRVAPDQRDAPSAYANVGPGKRENPSILLNDLMGEPGGLRELHTHLMGMGNANFWVHTLLTDRAKFPSNKEFMEAQHLRERYGPLVWSQDYKLWVNRTETAMWFAEQVGIQAPAPAAANAPPPPLLSQMGTSAAKHRQRPPASAEVPTHLANSIKQLPSCTVRGAFSFNTLITDRLRREWETRGLDFATNFSYDLILTLTDLAAGLGISAVDRSLEMVQSDVEEKLAIHLQPDVLRSKRFQDLRDPRDNHDPRLFKYYII